MGIKYDELKRKIRNEKFKSEQEWENTDNYVESLYEFDNGMYVIGRWCHCSLCLMRVLWVKDGKITVEEI